MRKHKTLQVLLLTILTLGIMSCVWLPGSSNASNKSKGFLGSCLADYESEDDDEHYLICFEYYKHKEGGILSYEDVEDTCSKDYETVSEETCEMHISYYSEYHGGAYKCDDKDERGYVRYYAPHQYDSLDPDEQLGCVEIDEY